MDTQLTNVICNVETEAKVFGTSQQPTSFFELLCNDFVTDSDCEEIETCICSWCKALNILENSVTSYKSITKQVDENQQTILHCAARCVSPRKGLEVTVKVLSLCKKFAIQADHLYKFTNAADDNGLTALQIAAKRKQKDLIAVLLRNYADINVIDAKYRTRAANLVSNQVQKEIVHLFDSHIHIVPDKLDPCNEAMWKVNYDFGPIAGSYKNFDEIHHQTKNLATWLRRGNTQKAEILLHPLMQIFLHIKGERYKMLRFISIIYHVAFYFCWVAVAHCEAYGSNEIMLRYKLQTLNKTFVNHTKEHTLELEFKKINDTLEKMGDQRIQAFLNDIANTLTHPILILLLVNVLKEVLMYFLSDKSLFYWRRWQNIFQWILYLPIITLCSNTDDFETLYFIVSIFIGMALIQDQLSKFEIFGLYSEIFAAGLKNVVKIGIAFLPFITAFSVTFSLLLPLNDEFQPFGFSKIATMIVGELNHDAAFFPLGKPYQTVYHPKMTKLWFFIFAIAITMLFQNLVIASTISDVQKMKSGARANFLAQRFDDIYFIENVTMHPFTLKLIAFVGLKRSLVRALNVNRCSHKVKRLDEYPRNLQKVIVEWQEKCRQGPYQSTNYRKL